MPLATDSDAAFDAKAFPALASLNPFGVSLEAIGAATATNADAALAAALGGDLPAITGQALKLLRVNAGETAAEFIDPATVVLAEVPELSQVQVENPASTVFGQVSGERLAQAFDANEQQIGVGQIPQEVLGSRSNNTSYQNTEARPISVSVSQQNSAGTNAIDLLWSADGVTFFETMRSMSNSGGRGCVFGIIPAGSYYKIVATITIISWVELR